MGSAPTAAVHGSSGVSLPLGLGCCGIPLPGAPGSCRVLQPLAAVGQVWGVPAAARQVRGVPPAAHRGWVAAEGPPPGWQLGAVRPRAENVTEVNGSHGFRDIIVALPIINS